MDSDVDLKVRATVDFTTSAFRRVSAADAMMMLAQCCGPMTTSINAGDVE